MMHDRPEPPKGSALPSIVLRTLEIGFGALLIYLLSSEGPRTIVYIWSTGILDAASSLPTLLQVDREATIHNLAVALGKLFLAALPSFVWILSSSRQRLLWVVPLVFVFIVLSSPLSLAACATNDRWWLLLVVVTASLLAQRFRYLRWTALLPYLILWEIIVTHGLLGLGRVSTETLAERERLLEECAKHDGIRPRNLTVDQLMPYYSVNLLHDDLALLTGEGPNDGDMRGHTGGRPVGSWWLRRVDGEFEFDRLSQATGNLWRGCVLDGTAWMARANRIIGARQDPDDPTKEIVHSLTLPSRDMDFGATTCDVQRKRVYATEATGGGLWYMQPDGSNAQRVDVEGVWLFPKRRFDDRIVVVSTGSLSVFDPTSNQVIERSPAGLANAGFDLCEHDGSAAVADMSGRLRVFTLDSNGHYQFAWGVSVFAPRRAAFSRDCSRIGVTSADDHSVFLIDSSSHEVVQRFEAGPVLREVSPTGPRELSVADLCSMTTFRW